VVVQLLSFAKKGLAGKGQQGYGPMTDQPFSEKQQIKEPVLDLDQQFQKNQRTGQRTYLHSMVSSLRRTPKGLF
jgi:hypothetical protein